MVGLFSKAVPVLADEDKIGGSAIYDTLDTGTFCKDGTRHALLSILLANQKRPCIAVAFPFSADEDKIGGSAITLSGLVRLGQKHRRGTDLVGLGREVVVAAKCSTP